MSNDYSSSIWRGRFIRYAPLVLWVGVIFLLSSSTGSMSETSRFIRPLLEFLFPSASDETLRVIHGYIRKSAHLTEYALLAFLAYRALAAATHDILRHGRFLIPLVIVLSVASIDEFNQSFNTARTGSGWDVLLDAAGGILMIAFLLMLEKTRLVKDRPEPSIDPSQAP